jgi:hypothetical protein
MNTYPRQPSPERIERRRQTFQPQPSSMPQVPIAFEQNPSHPLVASYPNGQIIRFEQNANGHLQVQELRAAIEGSTVNFMPNVSIA